MDFFFRQISWNTKFSLETEGTRNFLAFACIALMFDYLIQKYLMAKGNCLMIDNKSFRPPFEGLLSDFLSNLLLFVYVACIEVSIIWIVIVNQISQTCSDTFWIQICQALIQFEVGCRLELCKNIVNFEFGFFAVCRTEQGVSVNKTQLVRDARNKNECDPVV